MTGWGRGNVHSADGWREVLEPAVVRYRHTMKRRYFRGDAVFANPEVHGLQRLRLCRGRGAELLALPFFDLPVSGGWVRMAAESGRSHPWICST